MRLKEFTTDFSNFEYDQYVKSKNVDEAAKYVYKNDLIGSKEELCVFKEKINEAVKHCTYIIIGLQNLESLVEENVNTCIMRGLKK